MNLKNISLVAVTAIALSISATARAPQKDIVDIAAGDKNFSTLVSLVKKAGLVETLKSKGPFTVFAPTNAAFAKLPKATLDAVGKDNALLKRVLTYHVLSGNVDSKAATAAAGKSVKTVEGGEIKVSLRGRNLMINNSRVTKADIKASNGVIHVIDTVLMPPSPAPRPAKAKGDCSSCSGK